jgi:hypothetical protein
MEEERDFNPEDLVRQPAFSNWQPASADLKPELGVWPLQLRRAGEMP